MVDSKRAGFLDPVAEDVASLLGYRWQRLPGAQEHMKCACKYTLVASQGLTDCHVFLFSIKIFYDLSLNVNFTRSNEPV